MIITPRAVEQVADRIEKAFRRRHPEWRYAGLDPRLWSSAAAILVDAHRRQSWVPIDPELFVASQTPARDPWHDLRRIVKSLRGELLREFRSIDTAVLRGASIDAVLSRPSRRLSPLGRYLAACRYGRPDLAEAFREAAHLQHESCPLYREASAGLIGDHDYPFIPLLPHAVRASGTGAFSLN